MAGLNAVFVPLKVRDIDAFFTRMVLPAGREVELNIAGFAVTMPHKVAAMQYLDETDETAKRIGAVNTIAIENGRFLGHNTDATGFISTLKSQIDVRGMRAAVLGAGGAARACVDALQREAVDVTVFARDANKAARFSEQLGVRADAISDLRSRISGFDILINATPVGMAGELASFTPLTARELKGVKLVFDLVTSPMDTPLIEQAKQAGVKTIPGVEMLIEQAVEQFEIWTGLGAPREAMRQAAVARMERYGER
jgi:3-dehydroquinate dehydratase/shikimate dehydrogenase